MILAGIDPGKTTGYCVWESDKNFPILVGEVEYPYKLWDLLKRNTDGQIIWIVEDYKIRPKALSKSGEYSHEWNPGTTPRVIGAIEYHAYTHGQKLVLQQPNIKRTGYRLIGKEYVKGRKDKTTNITDAIAHVAYWKHKHQGPFEFGGMEGPSKLLGS